MGQSNAAGIAIVAFFLIWNSRNTPVQRQTAFHVDETAEIARDANLHTGSGISLPVRIYHEVPEGGVKGGIIGSAVDVCERQQ